MQRLNPIALGLAIGIIWGVWMLIVALANIVTQGYGAEWIIMLSSVYPGFGGTLVGAIIGLGWGLADGFIVGALVAWIYNGILRPAPAPQPSE
ncbi:MAG: bacteriophage holin [Armatimonadota bacterium]|nr:MAG: bacteriophage holin [Armatimonadota bacterium]